MKKILTILFILTLMISGCSQEQAKKPLTKDQIIKKMQKSVKNTDSITLTATSKVTTSYDKFTTKFDTETESQYDSVNLSALKVIPESNNTKFKVNPFIYNLNKNNETIFPETEYISYRAKKADRDYLQGLQSNMVNLTDIVQNVIKTDTKDIQIKDNQLSYQGVSKSIEELYDYGFNFSGMNQIPEFNKVTDLNIQKGYYELKVSETNKYVKTLYFDITITGKINDKPVTIHMEQTTDYKNFNNTNVKPFESELIEK